MKTIIILICLLIAGCAHIQYGDFEYTRIGDQKIEGLVVKTPEGIKVELNKQESTAEVFKEALKLGMTIAAK